MILSPGFEFSGPPGFEFSGLPGLPGLLGLPGLPGLLGLLGPGLPILGLGLPILGPGLPMLLLGLPPTPGLPGFGLYEAMRSSSANSIGVYSDLPLGPGLVGPGLVGPGLVGPGLVGPGLELGPGLLGPGLLGPGLLGPGAGVELDLLSSIPYTVNLYLLPGMMGLPSLVNLVFFSLGLFLLAVPVK